MVGIFDSFVLGFIHVVEGVADGLTFAHGGIGELLGERSDLRKVFQLQRDAGAHAVADQFPFRGFPVVHGFDRIGTDLGGFGIDAIVAHDLADLFGLFGGLIVGGFGVVGLRRDVELHERRVGRSVEFAVRAGEQGVGCGVHSRRLRQEKSGR